jgi:hypothetical protein
MMAENPTNSASSFGSEFRRLIPGLLLTVLVAFGTSWWNSQLTQNELRFRLDRIEERQKEASASTAEAARVAQGNAIRMAELGIIQNNVVEQLREVKSEHERLMRR